MNGTSGNPPALGVEALAVKMEPLENELPSMSGSSNSSASTPVYHNGVKPLSPEQEELIHRLVYFQNEYEHPSEEDIKKISVS